jgi:hypothetical protein
MEPVYAFPPYSQSYPKSVITSNMEHVPLPTPPPTRPYQELIFTRNMELAFISSIPTPPKLKPECSAHEKGVKKCKACMSGRKRKIGVEEAAVTI